MLTFKEFLAEELIKAYKDISFEYHDDLHPAFWVGDKLRPEVCKQCLKIVEKFLGTFDDFKPPVIGINFTGSLANYNYNSKSDVDIHIIMDSKGKYGKIDPEEFFKAKLKNFREEYKDITMKGYPVEVSIEMSNEGSTSTGVYDLENDEWVKEPKVINDPEVEHDEVVKKFKILKKEAKQLLNSNASPDEITAFIDRIRKTRKKGLKKDGELSVDNLAFKALRKSGMLDKLRAYAFKANTKSLTMS